MTDVNALEARCTELAASDQDVSGKLDALFAEPGELAQGDGFDRMIKAFLVAASPDRGWACLSPLVRRWMADPRNRKFRHHHSVVKYFLDVYATIEAKDPRWIDLAIDAMADDSIYDETFIEVLDGQDLPAAKVDALLADGKPPRALLRVLALRGDPRVREPLEKRLLGSSLDGYEVVLYADLLRALPEHDEATIELEVAKRLAGKDVDGKALSDSRAEELIKRLTAVSPMASAEAYELARQNLSKAKVRSEWGSGKRVQKDLLAKLETVKPAAS